MKFLAFGALLTATVAGIGSAAFAQQAPVGADGLRRQLTDACIVEVWRRPEMKAALDTAVRRCQCATGKAFGELKPEDVAAVSYTRPLTGAVRSAMLAAFQTCK